MLRLGQRRFSSLFSEYSFAQLDLHPSLQAALRSLKFERLTRVQADSFCSVSLFKDVVLSSETGSGKTLAYLLPLMNRILHSQTPLGPPVVVLAPTLDLCAQILKVAQSLDPDNALPKQLLTGSSLTVSETGVIEAPRIRWGVVDLVLATPAKLAEDILRFGPDKFLPAAVVLDEADLLFHGTSQAAILDVFKYLRPRVKRAGGGGGGGDLTTPFLPTQFVFASATLPAIGPFTVGSVLAQRFSTADVIRTTAFHSLPASIRTDWVPELDGVWETRCFLLTQTLKQLVEEGGRAPRRILVFANSVSNCRLLHAFLVGKEWPAEKFFRHTSADLTETAARFNQSESLAILVCTDIAARGMDWASVDAVVNFQLPTDVVTWLHRAGRCGRMGKPGTVVSFFKRKEEVLVGLLRGKVEAGKSLSGLFSHKRSLKRRLASPNSVHTATPQSPIKPGTSPPSTSANSPS